MGVKVAHRAVKAIDEQSPDDLRFKIVAKDAQFQQGDIIENCIIISPPKRIKITGNGRKKQISANLKAETHNVIILEQTCDLRDGDFDLVSVAPIYTTKEYIRHLRKKRTKLGLPSINKSEFASWKKNRIENLQKNPAKRYYYIPGCTLPGFSNDGFVVDFGNKTGLTIDYLKKMANKQGDRLTLQDNFKHDLSHKLGDRYSRIDVPRDENDN